MRLEIENGSDIDEDNIENLMYTILVGKRFRFQANKYEENIVMYEIEEVGDYDSTGTQCRC